MTAVAPTAERDAARAAAAWLLARWWSRPDEEERAWWRERWPQAREANALLGVPAAALEELAEAETEADGDALREEHERLLNGPGRAPCPPYESLWREDVARREQGVLMGAAAAEVAAIYAALGLAVSAGAHELPDHLAVEWEAFAYALEQGEDEAASALLAGHLAVWTPRFHDAVAAQAAEPFYGALARVSSAWTSALSD